MKGQCPNCEGRFKIDDSKGPDKGVYGKCHKCSERSFLSKTVSVTTNSEAQSRQENSQDPSLKSKVATNSLQNNKTVSTQTSMSPSKTNLKEKSVPIATPSMRWIRNIAAILGSFWFFFVSCMIGPIPGVFVAMKMDERKVEKGEELHRPFKVVVGGNAAMRMDELEWLISRIKEAEDNIHSDSFSMKNFFLMSEPSGRFESESSIFSYKILSDDGGTQFIVLEAEDKDGGSFLSLPISRSKSDSSSMPNLFLASKPSGIFGSFTYEVLSQSGDEQLIELRVSEQGDDGYTTWSRYKARRTSISPVSSQQFNHSNVFMAIPLAFGFSFSLFIIGRILLSATGTTTKPTTTMPNPNSYKFLTVVKLLAFILGGVSLISASIHTIKLVNMWMLHFSGNSEQASLTAFLFSIIINWSMAIIPILLGYFMSKRRQLDFSRVLSVLLCIYFPFGTIVGIISIVILSIRPIKQQFTS